MVQVLVSFRYYNTVDLHVRVNSYVLVSFRYYYKDSERKNRNVSKVF